MKAKAKTARPVDPSKAITCELELEPYETSIGEMLRARAEEFGARPLLFDKDADGNYQSHSWTEIFDEIKNVGVHLLAAGVKPGDRLAMLSENRREMLVLELATMAIGALSVPIFAGYYTNHVDYILKNSGARRITVSTPLQLQKLESCQALAGLEAIVIMDNDIEETSVKGVPVIPYEELTRPVGQKEKDRFLEAICAVSGNDSCFVMYTSGTTGYPKGVELTHSNLLSQQRAIKQLWDVGFEDRFLSYLSWHHSFGGLFERFMVLYSGASMALDESGGKDVNALLKNWRSIIPTVFFSVPGVYQKIADEIRMDPGVRDTVFHDKLRFVFTAAAPLPHDVSELFTTAGIPVLEGWGLTETSPCVTLTDPKNDRFPAVVGWPIPGVMVRLSEEGEIQVKGPNVMKGYYLDPQQNEAVFTADGWFRTGDLGEVHKNGMRILGRRDGMFKLLNAEKVFAAQIESALVGGSEFIDQAVVLGDGHHYVTALLFANRIALKQWARERGLHIPDGDDIAHVSDVRRLFAHEVQRINNVIAGRFQRVRKFVIFGNELSLENGELT
ncbi:MAG: AMP-binding protein, partial [Candidatus Obscuribacterales bacterium]|nr:AMP-binding protein [Candidatus Obscuribacterales bacterium]